MENLGIDYKLLIAQIINFGLLLFLFSKFMAKPFLKYLKEEKHKDEERDRIVQELSSKEERMLAEQTKWNQKMKAEQEKILDETKRIADKLRADILTEAKEEAEAVVAKAHTQIEEERQSFYREAKRHIGDVSLVVIEQALQKYLTSDVRKKLTDHIISNFKNSKN